MSTPAIYEARIGLKGTVNLVLIQEGTVQANACSSIQTLSASLGSVTEHDQYDGGDQPVNVIPDFNL